MHGAMVGCEKQQIVVSPDFGIENIEKLRYIPVKLHVYLVILLTPCAVSVPDSIGRRYAYAKHISNITLSELLVIKDSLRHFEGHRYSFVACFYIISGLGVVPTVEILYPFRQFIHVISARNEVSGLLIPPVSGISIKACRQYSGTVFDRNTEYTRLIIGGYAQYIAYCGGPHIAWRHLTCTVCASYTLN